jgi:transcription elongation GreA/GreB family factor
MNNLMSLKARAFEICRELIAARRQQYELALQELTLSMGSETKSSAGDKYETGRAMIHIEQDAIRRQLAEVLSQGAVLDTIDAGIRHSRIGPGSLVRAGGTYYFLSTALGKVIVDGQVVFALSAQSPLGARLAGNTAGGVVEQNGRQLRIEEVA